VGLALTICSVAVAEATFTHPGVALEEVTVNGCQGFTEVDFVLNNTCLFHPLTGLSGTIISSTKPQRGTDKV
jgi:hypothetical protein